MKLERLTVNGKRALACRLLNCAMIIRHKHPSARWKVERNNSLGATDDISAPFERTSTRRKPSKQMDGVGDTCLVQPAAWLGLNETAGGRRPFAVPAAGPPTAKHARVIPAAAPFGSPAAAGPQTSCKWLPVRLPLLSLWAQIVRA